jgi:hypothetical protein
MVLFALIGVAPIVGQNRSSYFPVGHHSGFSKAAKRAF